MDVSWIKVKTEMFEDEKIKLIESLPEGDSVIIFLVRLWIQAGKCNDNGLIYLTSEVPYTPEMLSTIFNKPLQIVKHALKILTQFSLIAIDNNGIISIPQWEKHQNIDGLDKIKTQTRLRVAKYRQKQKLLAPVTLQIKQEGVITPKPAEVNDTQSEANITYTKTSNTIQNQMDVTLHNVTVTKQNKNKNKILIYDQMFEVFWNKYPRKVAKKKAESIFKRLNPNKELLDTIISSLNKQIQTNDWKKEQGKYIPYPATYLAQERWTDLLPETIEEKSIQPTSDFMRDLLNAEN